MDTAEDDDAAAAHSDPEPRPSWWTELSDALAALLRSMWREARDREREGWPPWWLRLFAALAAAAILGLFVVPLARAVVFGIGGLVADLAGWVHDQAYARIVLDPVRNYLNIHAAGLPVAGTVLWWTWCLAGGVLLLFSLLRSFGARIGWALYGAASTAMVAAGTAGPGRWIAAGVCSLWWSLLSIPALWRRRPPTVTPARSPTSAPAAFPPAPAATASTVPEPTLAEQDDPRPDDDAARAADLYETLIRREQLAGSGPQRWTVTTSDDNRFTAVSDDGQHAAGTAISSEAVRELLAGLADPPGARPHVDWTNASPVLPRLQRLNVDNDARRPSITEFVDSSAATLAELAAAIRELREQWPLAELPHLIDSRAALLNRAYPLVSDVSSFAPTVAGRHDGIGWLELNDWVPTETVVSGGGAGSWNDFGSHRPRQVALIIQKLLTAPDPGRALAEILTDDGHVYLTRYPGPAGPIHRLTVNGTHRTHALRLLGVRLVAAEVAISSLPLRVDAFSTATADGWGEGRNRGPTAAIWRALVDRGHLSGRITGSGYRAVLEPYRVTAPWLLIAPRSAAALSAAYDRLYPGALGIPAEAMAGPAQWCQWLLGDPYPAV